MKKASATVILALVLSGCSYFLFQPFFYDEYKTHPLGMKIYNKTGHAISEQRWQYIFWAVGDGYKGLEECVGGFDKRIDLAFRTRPIIIIPPRHIDISNKDEMLAFTDLEFVYIREDYFFAPQLRHEWLHIYLFEKGRRLFGNPSHSDDLFIKCGR